MRRLLLMLSLPVLVGACGRSRGGGAVTNNPAASSTTAAVAAAPAPPAAGKCPANAGLTGAVTDHGAGRAAGAADKVDAGDFFFSPTCLTNAPAGAVTLTVHNGGQALHNVSVPDQGVDTDVPSGQTVTVSVKVGSTAVGYFCKYHRASGMAGSLIPGPG